MKIWVDADACPVVIKGILFRAAERAQIFVTLVANHGIPHPESEYIRAMQVAQGFDVADNYIVQQVRAGDLVVTSDIPLAADVLKKDAHALNPRGERYRKDSIDSILTMRNFMDTLRGSGTQTGGPSPLSHADRQAFANQLDRLLMQAKSK